MKILFLATNRPHLARQKLLLKELKKNFEVVIWSPKEKKGSMTEVALDYAQQFNKYLKNKDFCAIIVRGDRFEMMGLTLVASYHNFPIIHLEGGDRSGVIDDKVRKAITSLADVHFATNRESLIRLINQGTEPTRTFNFGSLDVEYAKTINDKELIKEPYVLVAYHAIDGECPSDLDMALFDIERVYKVIRIKGNNDYGKQYGTENYSPEDYINILRGAVVALGNSSSLLKEASILGTPVVNIGGRQNQRLKPKNVIDVPCETDAILAGFHYHIMRDDRTPDETYYQKGTSKLIANKIKQIYGNKKAKNRNQ